MASTNATIRSKSNRSVGAYRLVKYGLGAALAASVANVLVLFVGLTALEFPSEFVGGPFGPLAVGPVVANSVVAAAGATLAYALAVRYAARPNRTFVVVSGVALVLSFAMFLAPDLAGAPPRLFGLLAAMHVTAAVAVVGILTRATNAETAPR